MTSGDALERVKQVYKSCITREQLLMAQRYNEMLIEKFIGWNIVSDAVYYGGCRDRYAELKKEKEMAELAMPMPL